MSLTTFSKFYFGHTVTGSNNTINFKEGAGPELTATISPGSYTLTDFLTAIKTALDTAGALTYTVTVTRSTRLITISAPSTFSLLVGTGSTLGTSAFGLIGFTGSDRTGSTSYTGNNASGFSFTPQFILQDHISTDDFRGAIDETVNISANGKSIEVITFGSEKFLQFSIRFATNINQPAGGPIRNNSTGLSNLRQFMQELITKRPIEYMADENLPNAFQPLILESTGESQNGTAYTLRERYDRGLPGYFDTSILRFRLLED